VAELAEAPGSLSAGLERLAWGRALGGAPWLGDAPVILDHRGRFQRRLRRELGDARPAHEWLAAEANAVVNGQRLDALRAEFEGDAATAAIALELWRQLDSLGYASEARSVARTQWQRDPQRSEPATEALAFELWERRVERSVNDQNWMAEWSPAAELRFEREVCAPYREVHALARHGSTRERIAARLRLWAPAP
jgi:hypothetical protein